MVKKSSVNTKKKIKIPNRPVEPFKPEKEMVKQYIDLDDGISLKYILDSIPTTIDINNVFVDIEYCYGDRNDKVRLSYYVMETDEEYYKRLKLYNKMYKTYEKDIKEYEKWFEENKSLIEEQQREEKEKTKKHLAKQIEQLNKQYKKLIKE